MLGDLGADVIKIEKPGSGDDTRGFAPPYIEGTKRARTSLASIVTSARSRSTLQSPKVKRSRCSCSRRATSWWRISKSADSSVTGGRYNQLKSRFPRLIYCSITGFGQTGPYATRPGYDSLIQAMGGVMSVTGDPNGEPQKVGVPLPIYSPDSTVASASSLRCGIATQPVKASRSTSGCSTAHVAWLANQAMNYLATGENPPRLGNQHPNIVPYQVFRRLTDT